MGKKNKREEIAKREKKFFHISIIVFVVGTILLTSLFLHFDLFTYKSVFCEFTEQEIKVNEKIKANSFVAEIDPYGDVIIPKGQISTDTVTYFQIGDYDERILAYLSGGYNYCLGYDSCHKCAQEGNFGWFYEDKGYLFCSNCGKGIELSELGSANPSSEVYPVPITEKMMEQRRSVLVIPKDVITELFNG